MLHGYLVLSCAYSVFNSFIYIFFIWNRGLRGSSPQDHLGNCWLVACNMEDRIQQWFIFSNENFINDFSNSFYIFYLCIYENNVLYIQAFQDLVTIPGNTIYIDNAEHKRLKYEDLCMQYDIQPLKLRWREHILCLMYRQSKRGDKLDTKRTYINLRSNKKVNSKKLPMRNYEIYLYIDALGYGKC